VATLVTTFAWSLGVEGMRIVARQIALFGLLLPVYLKARADAQPG